MHVLTGLSSWSVRSLTNWPAGVALVLTGGGLGGCRWVWGRAGATADVRLTYSDRSISNWGAQEPRSQTREEPEEPARKAKTEGSKYVTHGWTHRMREPKEAKNRRNTGRTWRRQPNSVYIPTGGVQISYLMCQGQTALGHHTNICFHKPTKTL